MYWARVRFVLIGVLLALSVASASAATPLNVPRSGSPIDRIDNLWRQTRPILGNDWNATLGAEEAARRRSSLNQAWMALKTDLGREQASADVRNIIQNVMGVISRVYTHAAAPSQATSESTTSKKPQAAGPAGPGVIEAKLARIDDLISSARGR